MTQDNDRRIYLPPPPPQIVTPATRPPQRVERDVVGSEDIKEELVERPPIDKKSDNYIPELGLSEKDEEEIFGTGERLDGSLDELERSDTADVLSFDSSDITGEPRKPKKRYFRRTSKRYVPPPNTMGGMRLW